MYKSLRSLVVLLILVGASLCLSFRIQIQQARATYVGGPIDKDTVWTLVDSPFVVSNDIIINANTTLTIEPGVEVRFGDNSSIIVYGTLVAQGTETANIQFTSNGINPTPGDWASIQLNDRQASASLNNCAIEYALNGITLDAGSLTIENSLISFNSENGIAIANATANVNNNNFENNTESGIYINGNNQAQIQNNNFTLNADGVTLGGSSNLDEDIQQNSFVNNTHSGISLIAASIGSTLIAGNTFFDNNAGFDVATQTSTNIANNYVFNNTVGILYESGLDHQAHFNDICNNTMGMNVMENATVNAQYNYWGDKSGPKHDNLNPYGKGNPVGGNGTTIKFIFFLTRPFESANLPPTAVLQTDKTLIGPNQNVTFIGTGSTDDGQVDQYFYDFNDTINTGWTTLSLFNHTFTSPGVYTPTLQVSDDFGVISQNVATATITVQPNLTPLNVAVISSNDTVNFDQNVSLTIYVSTGTAPADAANVRLISVEGGSFTQVAPLPNSPGYFTAVFTAPNVTQVTNARIIASASMNGYADGSDYTYVKILPPLYVQIMANPTILNSEDYSTIAVYVTDSFGDPVDAANLTLSVDNGNLSATTGATNSNGQATFSFTAPQVLSQINATISVTADKDEYASGQSQQIIMINPRLLVLAMTANPSTIISESTSTITIHLTWNSSPVSNATLTASSSMGGNFSSSENTTDSNGDAAFVFIAPQVTVHDGVTVNITIDAYENGYVNTESQVAINVIPKILLLQITANPSLLTSGVETNITAHVTSSSDSNQVSGVNVTIASENGGNFNTTAGMTDRNGDVTFLFTAPIVNASLNLTVSASAQKAAYADGQNVTLLMVNPGKMTVDVKANSPTVASRGSTVIDVFVTSNSTYVANASVTISSNYGNFSAKSAITDASGHCAFIFNAPKTNSQLPAVITATVTKNGFVNSMNQTMINVTPEEAQTVGGLPLTTLLLILIPVIIAIVVVVLIRLKVLSISFKEEEE
ncbi:MAG TPA: Ig-like domain-containing protein [Candidatus Acidoferrum sp.]|nr:Ig-like domain-containing protein [Candidatus Acidoferrum sp.]